jgi:DNA-binding MarR family transcriptional regulator
MKLNTVPERLHLQPTDYASKADEITYLIRRLIQAEKVYSKQLNRSYRVSRAQMNCLRTLYENGPLPPSTIAKNITVKASTVTGVVDRLERKGMVARFRNIQDRRGIGIQLTEAGREFIENGPRPIRECILNGLKHLTESETDYVIRALTRVVDMLETRKISLKSPP